MTERLMRLFEKYQKSLVGYNRDCNLRLIKTEDSSRKRLRRQSERDFEAFVAEAENLKAKLSP